MQALYCRYRGVKMAPVRQYRRRQITAEQYRVVEAIRKREISKSVAKQETNVATLISSVIEDHRVSVCFLR